MTEGVEAQSFTTTMVIESKNGEAGHPPARVTKRTATDDLYTTFSSPMAWILVVALVVTWSCVAIIMFDLMDYKGLTELKVKQATPPAEQVVCPCMHSSKPKEATSEPTEGKEAEPPKKEPVVRAKRERDMCRPVDKEKRREAARKLELEAAIRKRGRTF
uniref:Triadin n=1 Tax=Oncorhynchus tshawytscha TaxID=74940 RepID=A0AAZ3ST96_ONCTS